MRVFAGAGTAVALQEGAETYQRHAVFAVQGAGDFFENGVEDAVGLLFGEICFFSNGCGEFWFTHISEAPLTVFCCYVRAALCGAAPKAPQVLYSAADGSEDGTQ
ncbi:hypothetical protein D3C84_1055510 [compost metagenome]